MDNCTIAIMKKSKREAQTKVFKPEIKEVKQYIGELRGKKIATIEETTTSQWLYVEFKDVIDRIVICDPYKNRLLSDGPKTDKIDAKKLCLLLKGYHITEVYHTDDEKYKLRKLVSSYEDVIKAGVRLLNQRSALLRAEGKAGESETKEETEWMKFIKERQKRGIELYEEIKGEYTERFAKECKKDKVIKNLTTIHGIGEIGAVKISGIVIQPFRFKNVGKYEAYCGLVRHVKESGNKNYGYRKPRYCRILKSVYKTAAMAAVGGNNPIREYYEYLRGKGIEDKNAMNAVSRYICRVSFGIMKNGEKYEPYRWRKAK
jgi:transposase